MMSDSDKKTITNSDWRQFRMRMGKYVGKTMFQIYAADYQYIEWALANWERLPEDIRTAMVAAKAHKDIVDPYSC
jgi:hypothetical protein